MEMFVREKIFDGSSSNLFQLALNKINQILHGCVKSGPFVGMKYVSESIESAHYPKLLGTYELELHPVIEELCNTNFDTIVNVGAGEGYYSIGFALRNNHVQILAFEPRSKGQQLLKDMASMNRVSERVTIHGLCDAPALEEALHKQGKSLVFMDCEGGEAILLDPRVCPSLKTATIVVELHPFLVPGVGEIIESRFQETHTITQVWTRARTVMDFPIQMSQLRRTVLEKHLLDIMFENRQELMRFFYLKPNQ
jgi:hypothetical protein